VLVGQSVEGMVHYRLLESDTFETKFEWTHEAGSDSPWIVALFRQRIARIPQSQESGKNAARQTQRVIFTLDRLMAFGVLSTQL